MATRSTAVGSLGVGSYETYANYNDGAGGLIGYARTSTAQTGITTAVDLTSMSLAVTPSSATRIIRIAYVINIVSTTDNDNCRVNVAKDGTVIDTRVFTVSQISAADGVGCASAFCIDVAPTAASHTYKLQFGRSGSSPGTWATQASSTQQTSLYIFDDGPSF